MDNDKEIHSAGCSPLIKYPSNKLSLSNKQKEDHCSCHKIGNYLFKKIDKFNILIIAKKNDNECDEMIVQIIKQFIDKNCIYYVEGNKFSTITNLLNQEDEKQDQNIINSIIQFDSKSHQLIIDLLVTIGGDGTILYAVNFFQNREAPPVFAIEKGTLGFMAMYQIPNIKNDIQLIKNQILIKQCLQIERKMRIYGKIINKETQQVDLNRQIHALNEIVVDRGGQSSVVILDLYCNSSYLTQVKGDGLIISTPTGSTAYALSAGGPILHNEVRSLSIIPICPFSLSFRTLILPYCTKLKIMLASNKGQAHIFADGQKDFFLYPEEELLIESSEYDVPIIIENHSDQTFVNWIDKLNQLLNWNNTSFIKGKKKSQIPELVTDDSTNQ